MKRKTKQQRTGGVPPEPVEDPFYGHSEWVDAPMKQAVSQEARRMSRHGGRTIRRPQDIVRTMGS